MKKIILVLTVLVVFLMTSCANQAKSDTISLDNSSDISSDSPVVEETTGDSQEASTPDQTPLVENNAKLIYEVVYDEQFEIWDPFTEILSDELLEKIGANNFTGSDEEIANQIFRWQQENMVYIDDPSLQMDVSYQGRWNLFMPGIYPASELLVEHLNGEGKIYGICSDYSIIFIAIANSYGLETRNNTFTKYKFSDVNQWVDPETTRGLAFEEYEALNEKLAKHNVNLTYDQIDRVARESYVHARPEVKINGEWVSFDGAGIAPTGEYLNEENYEALPYYAQYSNVMLYAPPALENNQLDVDHLAELLSYWPQLDYEGITDDAGNDHRAAKFIDLCRGLGLIPYYEDPYMVLEFLNIDSSNTEEVLDDLPEIMEDYQEGTGKLFYAIADFLIWGDEEIEPSKYVYLYNTLTNGDLTEAEFIEYIK